MSNVPGIGVKGSQSLICCIWYYCMKSKKNTGGNHTFLLRVKLNVEKCRVFVCINASVRVLMVTLGRFSLCLRLNDITKYLNDSSQIVWITSGSTVSVSSGLICLPTADIFVSFTSSFHTDFLSWQGCSSTNTQTLFKLLLTVIPADTQAPEHSTWVIIRCMTGALMTFCYSSCNLLHSAYITMTTCSHTHRKKTFCILNCREFHSGEFCSRVRVSADKESVKPPQIPISNQVI